MCSSTPGEILGSCARLHGKEHVDAVAFLRRYFLLRKLAHARTCNQHSSTLQHASLCLPAGLSVRLQHTHERKEARTLLSRIRRKGSF
jgi:hypothetical protein